MEQVLSWALEQAPVVAILIIGFVALWRNSKAQEKIICDMLEQCWKHVLNEHEVKK